MFTPDQARQNALDKLPPGFAWTRDPASTWGRMMAPGAAEQVAFEQAAEALLEEATPSGAGPLLPDYQRVLGPDPCLGSPGAGALVALAQLRQSVHARWTEQGGASRQHYIDLAAKLGYAITIEEFRPLQAGFRAGAQATPVQVRFTWRVHAPPAPVTLFRAGSLAGQRLTTAGLPWLECNLRRRSPDHTTLVLAFDGIPGAPQ